ncbi:hypothetical protein H6S82_05145 [Planktothrix sp. FACHB-1355]|uniref:Uncharacterized protein n=1 Tax=Aerosakkonema funiforme FACHB-1375 TaxID=2949571 RepID=A0A926ZL76_9CYAN|nr:MULTISPECIES: hypothetical protein [Oscillatoriales]MBD2186112.1 hypothetical protein [Aerosakkonema funiforme FACHB-1375]MBD3558241.1 hypothetical protein [Planktothrix sp. FACHB-1355]
MPDVSELLQALSDLNEEELEARLGMRAQTIGEDLKKGDTRSASVDSLEIDTAVPRGALDDALAAGQRLFNWISPAAYNLLCTPLGGDTADETMKELVKLLDEDLEKNIAKAAGMLAPFLVSSLGLAPAIAAVVATLIIKRTSKQGGKLICDRWKNTLPTTDPTVTSESSFGA